MDKERPTMKRHDRLKLSIGDAEATVQHDALPAASNEILAQVQTFQQDITRNSRRTIRQYCLIGRNYCASPTNLQSWTHPFLINLYKLSASYPKISQTTVGIRELKANFRAVKEYVAEDKVFWR